MRSLLRERGDYITAFSPTVLAIPALNPDENFVNLIREIRHSFRGTILVVDDGSSERCSGVFTSISRFATILHHSHTKGKGAALKTAAHFALNSEGKHQFMVTADCDGQHIVADILRLIEWTQAHSKESRTIAIGVRRLTASVPLRSFLGNFLTRKLLRVLLQVELQDSQCGLRAIHRSAFKTLLDCKGVGFELETEFLLYCLGKNFRVVEIPIKTCYINKNQTSHFRAISDSFKICCTIIKFFGGAVLFRIAHPFAFNINKITINFKNLVLNRDRRNSIKKRERVRKKMDMRVQIVKVLSLERNNNN